jgi:hypothetical protein
MSRGEIPQESWVFGEKTGKAKATNFDEEAQRRGEELFFSCGLSASLRLCVNRL